MLNNRKRKLSALVVGAASIAALAGCGGSALNSADPRPASADPLVYEKYGAAGACNNSAQHTVYLNGRTLEDGVHLSDTHLAEAVGGTLDFEFGLPKDAPSEVSKLSVAVVSADSTADVEKAKGNSKVKSSKDAAAHTKAEEVRVKLDDQHGQPLPAGDYQVLLTATLRDAATPSCNSELTATYPLTITTV